jgi:hypothetical protein
MSKAAKSVIPAGHIHIKENILKKDNITGVSESKATWAKDLDLPKEGAYTFFAACGYQHMKYVEGMMKTLKGARKMGMDLGKVVGITRAFGKVGMDLTGITARITASKIDPYTPVLISSINVLKKLGVEVGYLGDEEPCCGSPMFYAGFEEAFASHAEDIYQRLNYRGVKKMIGLVPACTSALRNAYPKYVRNYDLEVQHVLEVVAARLKKTENVAKARETVKVTYHDPCQLSRYLQITDEPRAIIRSIEGIEFIEPDPEQCGKWSTCCGGGNLETTHPELGERVGIRRMEELLQTGAQLILSNCPACEFQLKRVAKQIGAEVRIMDLMTFLDEALN